MEFFKYTFKDILSLGASDDNIIFPIKGNSVLKHNGRKGSYVTPHNISKNYSAQFRLAISFSPNFRNMLDSKELLCLERNGGLRLLDNEQHQIGSLSTIKLDDLPRVWPSYGYFGGAREIFLEFHKNALLKLARNYTFNIPGRMDFYHSDDDEEVKMKFINSVLQGIYSLFGEEELEISDGIGSAKITQSGGIAINFANYKRCNVNLTASISYKELVGNTYVKCWLNAWKDDENKLTRKIYFTQEAEYFFKGLNVKYLASIQKFPIYVFTPLFEVLKYYLHSKGCFKRILFNLSLPK